MLAPFAVAALAVMAGVRALRAAAERHAVPSPRRQRWLA